MSNEGSNQNNQTSQNILRAKIELSKALVRVAQNFKKDDITVVMPTYVPQRGEILEELTAHGVKAIISGGIKGAKCFKSIEQYGMKEDTAAHVDKFDITKEIVENIPEEKLKNKKVAIFSYVNSLGWGKHLEDRKLNTEVVGTVEQNLRSYFEEKGNLLKILDTAGLSAYKIPTEHVNEKTSDEKLKEVYNKVKNEDGRVVVQDCCSKVANAGGKGTVFINSEKEFIKAVREYEGERKVARFVKGFESNLSFFAGNMVPEDNNKLGAKKINLDADMDQFNPDTLDKILAKAEKEGINESNTVTVVGRGTLKAVGDDHLTNCEANGVGNDVGFVYDDKIRNQIKEVGQKLSALMARAGKVGLAGADMIIDKDGKVWINEINDRQQGPTAQMSKDAENNGIPSLVKASLVASYGDFKDEQVQNTFKALKKESENINDAYTKARGEFYLKVQATHKDKTFETVTKNLEPGYYDLVKQENGDFKLDYASRRPVNDKVEYKTDPTKDVMTVKLEGGDFKKGDQVKGGQQLVRLTGVADPNNPPFVIENGKTVLNKSWEKAVKACYEHMFDKGYMEKNPLLQKRREEKAIEDQKKKIVFSFNQMKAARDR